MHKRGRQGGATGRPGALVRRGSPCNNSAFHTRLPFTDLAVLVLSLVCSAFLLGYAVSRPEHPWIGWVGLTPLFLVIRSLTPLRAMSCGALWGLCFHAFIVSGNGTTPTPLVKAPVLLILIPGIYAYASAFLTRRIGFRPLFLAFGWVGVEFLLQPLGLGSGLLATTQGDGGIIQALGGSLGYLFVAFIITFVNAKLLAVVGGIRFAPVRLHLGLQFDCVPGCLIWPTFSRVSLAVIHSSQPRAPPV
ncbi:hypothetical protein ACFLQW_00955 [Candidatus Zixiibacteriota bacterium]